MTGEGRCTDNNGGTRKNGLEEKKDEISEDTKDERKPR